LSGDFGVVEAYIQKGPNCALLIFCDSHFALAVLRGRRKKIYIKGKYVWAKQYIPTLKKPKNESQAIQLPMREQFTWDSKLANPFLKMKSETFSLSIYNFQRNRLLIKM
jgi:hypothetical protein